MTKHADLAAVAAAAADGAPAPEAATETEAPIAPPEEAAFAAAETEAPEVDLDQVRREAVAEERKRMAALDALALPGCEEVLARARAEGAGPGEAAIAIVAHIRKTGALDISRQLATAAETVPPIEAGAGIDGAPVKLTGEDAWRDEHARSEKLRAEFPDVDAYVAYRKAEGSGRARIYGKA